jgi:hypothetical protein
MADLEHANAVGVRSDGEALNVQLMAGDSILPFAANPAKDRLLRRDEQRRATRALDELLGGQEHGWHPSLAWDRRVAKELLDAGWDREYLIRRFNLNRTEVAA